MLGSELVTRVREEVRSPRDGGVTEEEMDEIVSRVLEGQGFPI